MEFEKIESSILKSNVFNLSISIRGKLGTFYQFGRNFGILFACAIGAFFSYIYSAMFFLGFTALFYATFTFLPQTPQYLLHRDETGVISTETPFYITA